MLIIKTQTREFSIRDGKGEMYFDMFCRMLLSGELEEPMLFPQPKKTELKQEEKPVEEKHCDDGYRGFLHITCSRCGRTKTFHAKERIKAYRCNDCGKETELNKDNMSRAYTRCECGTDSHYYTNSEDDETEIPCINCGSHVHVTWNSDKKVYETYDF